MKFFYVYVPGNDTGFENYYLGFNLSLNTPMIKGSNITIKDIARRLGISTSTVSRALTDSTEISKSTKEAVLELARQLDYQPNTIAQSLKKQQTNIIGIILPETVNRFFSKAIGGIQEVATKSGYNIMACQSNESWHSEINNVETLIKTRVEGLIVAVSQETADFAHFQKAIEKGIPLVFFDRIIDELETPKVFCDNYDAAYKATQHLIDIGCNRIARINGPKHLFIGKWRYKGYEDALTQNGMHINEDYIIHTGYHTSKVTDYINHLLDLPHPPDGIFAINDECAIQMIKVIKSRGLKIPEDIAIIGFNNEFYNDFVEPTLSSVEIPAFEMGKVAAELFIKSLKDDNMLAEKRILPSKLIVRESTTRNLTA